LAVDFNCIENKNIDNVGGNNVYGDVGANILGTIRNHYHLVDAYRTCFPHHVATSWVSADGTVACRLDRFYVSASLKSHLAACMTPCAFSDHSAVEITLTLTRSSADADNGLDAYVGQSRSTNISGPFQVK